VVWGRKKEPVSRPGKKRKNKKCRGGQYENLTREEKHTKHPVKKTTLGAINMKTNRAKAKGGKLTKGLHQRAGGF